MRVFDQVAFNSMLDPEYLFRYGAALEHVSEYEEAEEFYGFASTLGEILTLPVCASKRTVHVVRKPFDQEAHGEEA